MSKHVTAVVNATDTKRLMEGLSKIPSGAIVAIIDDNTYIPAITDDQVLPVFDDPKIGFVYTDVMVEKGSISFIEYLDGQNLPNIPFFMRLVKGIVAPTDESNIKMNLMQQIMQKGYYFEHIAEPLVAVSV